MDIRALLLYPEDYETKIKLEEAPYRFGEEEDELESDGNISSGKSGFA